MKDSVSFVERGNTLVARLACELDHHRAAPIREMIDKKLLELRPKVLELDFCEVNFMDSSGLGLIIGRAEVCRDMNADVHVVGLNPTLSKLMRISGIEKISNVVIGRT